ncbi:MAG: PEGA domain-containing protein [bacterium]|nr:PEGA domain-containing protein [bacterium]
MLGMERLQKIIVGLVVVSFLLTSFPAEALPSNSFRTPLHQVYQRAEQDYWRLDLEKAELTLRQGLERAEAEGLNPEEVSSLIPSNLLLGQIYLAMDQESKARAAFQEAVRLDPEYWLSPEKFSPGVRGIYDSTREQFLNEQKNSLGEIEVGASHKVTVFLNGTKKGTTPLRIRDLPPGRHVVVLEREGYRTEIHSLDLPAGGTAEVNDSLTKTGFDRETAKAEKKPFWKRPAFLIVGGLVLAGAGAGAGLALSGGSGGSGSQQTSLSIEAPILGAAQ